MLSGRIRDNGSAGQLGVGMTNAGICAGAVWKERPCREGQEGAAKMRAGRRLEKVVHYIESVVAGSENVTVESPKRLRDKTTGRLREHDVVVTVRQEHHTLIIALECRERSRPVGVPQVEAF